MFAEIGERDTHTHSDSDGIKPKKANYRLSGDLESEMLPARAGGGIGAEAEIGEARRVVTRPGIPL